MRLSNHSIKRYQQRVDDVPHGVAAFRLAALAADATHRPRPRHWTPVAPTPGLTFVYPHARPDVCLLVKQGVVVTLIDRASVRRWSERDRLADMGGGIRGAEPYRRPSPGALTFGDAA